MKLSYTEIFKYSDMLNPVSPVALFSEAKLAQLRSGKTMLDLGCGKGVPSLFWASVFDVRIEGFGINENYVGYANSHAKMLNLSHRVRYSCKDIRKLKLDRKYDAVASLGLGIAQTYGDIRRVLSTFRAMLHKKGILIIAEPVWLVKPVSPKALKALGENEDSFPTELEMRQLMEKSGFQVLGHFVSSKEDWELYVRPVYIAMNEIIKTRSEFADEARRVMNGFKAEHAAVCQHWDMILWVARREH
jgi:cyclopropane fatty-acyl-phospholipid synthase-like methyltransferase